MILTVMVGGLRTSGVVPGGVMGLMRARTSMGRIE